MLQKIDDTLRRTEEIAALILVTAMTLIIAAQITWRYFLNDPLSWSEEATQFILICLTFVAATAVLKRSEHYSIDIFMSMIPEGKRHLVAAFSYLVQLVLVLGLAYYTLGIARLYTGTTTVLLKIPEEIKAYVMIYCFLSMAFFLCRRVGMSLRREG